MTEIDIKITNPNGFTPRLAAELVEEANNYECGITLSDTKANTSCDLKSIMNVFGCIIGGVGTTLHIEFDGVDEAKALKGFEALTEKTEF